MFQICQVLDIYLFYNLSLESYSLQNLIFLYHKVDRHSKLYNKTKIFQMLKKKYNLLITHKKELIILKQYQEVLNRCDFHLSVTYYNKKIKLTQNYLEYIRYKLYRIEYNENLLLKIYNKN